MEKSKKNIRKLLKNLKSGAQTEGPFPTYTNGERKRDPETDERIGSILKKIFKRIVV